MEGVQPPPHGLNKWSQHGLNTCGKPWLYDWLYSTGSVFLSSKRNLRRIEYLIHGNLLPDESIYVSFGAGKILKSLSLLQAQE